MIAYIGRRFLWIIPVLFTVSIITFFLMHAVPGGPWDREKRLPAATAGPAQRQVRPRPADLRPVHHTGPASSSRATSGRPTGTTDRTVNDIVADGFWTTVQLGVMAFILSVVVGIPLGIFAALGHNRGPDYLSTSVSIIGIATPSFVLSILLIVFFAVQLGWFPTGGWKGPAILGPADDRPGRVPDRGHRPLHPRVDARGDPQGLHPDGPQQGRRATRRVVSRHMIRNALIPVVTILGPTLAFLVTGSFIIETDLRDPGDRPVLHHVDLDA